MARSVFQGGWSVRARALLRNTLWTLAFVTCAAAVTTAAGPPSPAAVLYDQLRTVGLDTSRVYAIREASLDREDIHVTFSTGTIAFSEDVQGHVTAAFFEGDGEILVVPPNRTERSSMALFTGAAILEERFSSAYLRFDDDTFERLKPFLRPAQGAGEFIVRWDSAARNLAAWDALSLLQSFTNTRADGSRGHRFLHFRLGGTHLGSFDVFLNSDSDDQVVLGQLNRAQDTTFFDVWAAFPQKSVRDQRKRSAAEADYQCRIVKYKISTRILPPRDLEADATLDLVATQNGVRTFLFELSRNLQVGAVTRDGSPVEFIQNPALEGSKLARSGNDLVAVVLPKPVEAGEKFQLRFKYAGSVLSDAGHGLLFVGARGTWYPNRGVAMSDFDLEFRTPAEWTLLATGKRTSRQTADGIETSRWVSERPMPLAGFNLGRYVEARAQSGNTVIEAFAARAMEKTFQPPAEAKILQPSPPMVRPNLPEQIPPLPHVESPPNPMPSMQAQAVAKRTATAVDFFSQHFGPFPYSSLALTQRPGKDSQGWPGLIFLSSYAFLDAREQRELHMPEVEQLMYRELMPAHEAAHEWWGDLVGWKGYRDSWLAEALANYSALLLVESHDTAHFHLLMDNYKGELLRPSKDQRPVMDAGPVTLGPRLASSHFPTGYDLVLYGRGAWLIHMLRYIVRDPEPGRGARQSEADPDARFYRVLRGLCQQFASRTLSTNDVIKAFEQELPRSAQYEGHKSLSWFMDSWVNGTAAPSLELSSVKFSSSNGKHTVRGNLLQRNAPQTQVTLVPIYATVNGQAVFVARLFADGPETPFHFEVPAGARKLVVDPFKTILSR
jgi:Peptidase family M1 domain